MFSNTKPSRNLAKMLLCAVFHKIKIISNNVFIDKVSGKAVGQFKCEQCDVKFLASKKRDLFRVYNGT